MKCKFKHAAGRAVVEYSADDISIEEVIGLLKEEAVISLSVVKQTPKQYFSSQLKKETTQ